MTDAYRDELASVLSKNRRLEEELAKRRAEVDELRRRRAEEDELLARLRGVFESRTGDGGARGPRYLGASVLALAAIAGACLLMPRGVSLAAPPSGGHGSPATTVAASPQADRDQERRAADPCETPGIRLVVDGDDAVARARGARDLAGHKYRKGGDRSAWFTVEGGPLYVHGVGDFLPGDTGRTRLSLLTVATAGESEGYRLARGGKSFLEVTRSDARFVAGRFEADMSKVADTTREPGFGTPVVRVRGDFCLPALAANPSDTGP